MLKGVTKCPFCFPSQFCDINGEALAFKYTAHCFEHTGKERDNPVAPTKASYDLIINTSKIALAFIELDPYNNRHLSARVIRMLLEAQETREKFTFAQQPDVDVEMIEDGVNIRIKKRK